MLKSEFTHSEELAILAVFDCPINELPETPVIVNTSEKLRKHSVDISRSVVVNTLNMLKAKEIITAQSAGMKGTVITIVDRERMTEILTYLRKRHDWKAA